MGQDIFEEIDPVDLEEGLLKRAKNRAMYLLGAKAYCRAELYKKLQKNYPDEICDKVVAVMEEYGFIDDEVYAKKLAAYLIKKKQFGLRKAKFEMGMKGLDKSLVDEVLEEYGADDMREEITKIIEKKYYDCLDDRKDIQRVVNALARRGYGFDDIKACISAVQQSIEDSDIDDTQYEE